MTRKKFQELNLSNAYLFAAAIQDEETCKITLGLLLGLKPGEDFNALKPVKSWGMEPQRFS